MKRIPLLSALFFVSITCLFAQTPVFEITNHTNGSGLVKDNDVFYRATAPSINIEHDFEIKNISGATQTVNITKTETTLNTVTPGSDVAEAYFCTGITCYPSNVMSAPLILAPNEVVSVKTDLTEASATGQSEVSYKFAEAKKSGQVLTLFMKYNNPLSVRSTESVFSNVSNVYPNPSSSKSYLNITSARDLSGVSLTVMNSLGSVVLSKPISITSGKNIITLDSENFSSGLYFVSVSSGSTVITKKITIIK